jgi:tetratricopeptide (TPR) repeat protein
LDPDFKYEFRFHDYPGIFWTIFKNNYIGKEETMMNARSMKLLLFLGIISFLLLTCQKSESPTLEQAMLLYKENKLPLALPLLEQLQTRNPADPNILNWLAETYRRSSRREEALKTVRQALQLDPSSSFAHTIMADLCNPMYGDWEKANSDTTWTHLLKAVECDSGDGNAWSSLWTVSIQRSEFGMMQRSLQKMVEGGFLTQAVLSYGRWMLGSLPEGAVLITSGDMDTYPPVALQVAKDFRTDVVVVNRSLLNTSWYARFVRDQAEVPLPFNDKQLDNLRAYKDSQNQLVTPSDQIIQGWVEQKKKGVFPRPLAVSITVDKKWYAGLKEHLRYSGPFMLWDGKLVALPDTSLIRKSLAGLNPPDFSGPWVSEQDRSPIRTVYTKGNVKNVTYSALLYVEQLLEAGRNEAARDWLIWTEELEASSELGPVFGEQIARLKERIETRTPGGSSD